MNLQNQEFGRERLTALSRHVNTLPVKKILQEIRQALEEFSEGKPLAADTRLVICKINGYKFFNKMGGVNDGTDF